LSAGPRGSKGMIGAGGDITIPLLLSGSKVFSFWFAVLKRLQ
jgi:hypothetical protein